MTNKMMWHRPQVLLLCLPLFFSFCIFYGDALNGPQTGWRFLNIAKGTADTIEARFENNGESKQFNLRLDERMFARDAVLIIDGEVMDVKPQSKHAFIAVNDQNGLDWGAATLKANGGDLIQGVFSINGEIHMLESGEGGRHELRRLSEDESASMRDEVVVIPGKIQPVPKYSATTRKASREPGDNAFFPGCYPMDARALIAQVSVAVDAGYFLRATAGATTQREQVDSLMLNIEMLFNIVRPLYLAQLNVQLVVSRVAIGTPSSASGFLSRSPSNHACDTDPTDTLTDFKSWVRDSGLPTTAAWHLLTDCHPAPGVVGVSYLGGLCETGGYNTGFSSWQFDGSTWKILAHEMGHTFGASHTFYNLRGGIMDYGSGQLFDGPVQFHPDNGPQMCAEISSQIARKCPWLTLSETEGSICGNGVLESDEACECTQEGHTSCGVCVGCRLSRSNVKCSVQATDGFVIRTPDSPKFVATLDASAYASAECCSNNQVSSRTCTGGRDICSPLGMCVKVCSRYLLPPCGYENSGCVQKCWVDNMCQGIELVTRGPPSVPVGLVPDGISCQAPEGTGTCDTGECILTDPRVTRPPVTSPPSDPGAQFTKSPTNRPTLGTSAPSLRTNPPTLRPATSTRRPTSRPSRIPSQSPSRTPSRAPTIACPRADLFVKCSSIRQTGPCTRMGCAWCGGRKGKCQPSRLLCAVPSAVRTLFAHCSPFKLAARPAADPVLPCPDVEEMALCGSFRALKACNKNTFLPCQWCGAQRKCVPRHPSSPCTTLVRCPRI